MQPADKTGGRGALNVLPVDVAPTLMADVETKGVSDRGVKIAYPGTRQAVRRLTPLECERLMGWPDDHTRWADDGTELPDIARYRMCGNGVVAPVAEWIARRLLVADADTKGHPTP